MKIKMQRVAILPILLHGRENLSLKLRKEQKMRACQFMYLSLRETTFTGDVIKFHSEEHHDLYY